MTPSDDGIGQKAPRRALLFSMPAPQPDSASVHLLTFSRTHDPSMLLSCTVEKKRLETVPQPGHRSHNFVLVPSYRILWPLPQFSLGHVKNVVNKDRDGP